jgi:uncharacterized protein YceK
VLRPGPPRGTCHVHQWRSTRDSFLNVRRRLVQALWESQFGLTRLTDSGIPRDSFKGVSHLAKHHHTILVAALCFILGGCGTVANLQKDGPPFGGVRESAEAGLSRVNSAGQGRCIPPIADYTAAGYWWLCDVPASAIGDTLTLPISISHSHASESRPDSISP